METKYLCPACLYLGQHSVLKDSSLMRCQNCTNKLKTADPKYFELFNIFSLHSKKGFHCPECQRFLPQVNSTQITCPYLDCSFSGSLEDLKRAHHPSLRNKELKPVVILTPRNSLINNCIQSLLIKLEFTKSDVTYYHKLATLQAFRNISEKYSNFSDYLLNNSRSGGFQHKLFQEYSKILESFLPFNIKKYNKSIQIESLLDINLNIFNGISTFETQINSNKIRNETREYYIGGRLGFYTQPYYIGKLLEIVDSNNNSLLPMVQEYSFNYIKLNHKINDIIKVTHLRIIPHYQMGGMVYINRLRKEIIQQCKSQ